MNDWPTTQIVSNWIFEAVKGHTKKKPENKKNCVRVVYADGYHIDLPVYCESNGIVYLARLGDDQWIPSDAKTFNNWFYERLEKTEQLRSCIKYLKAWKDFKGCDLKGIHITVLAGLNHVAIKDRDDDSLTQTIQKIIAYVKTNHAIYNPVDNSENLISGWNLSQIDKTVKVLEKLAEDATIAIGEKDKEIAARVWGKLFGDRFKQLNEGKIKIEPVHREIQPISPWNF